MGKKKKDVDDQDTKVEPTSGDDREAELDKAMTKEPADPEPVNTAGPATMESVAVKADLSCSLGGGEVPWTRLATITIPVRQVRANPAKFANQVADQVRNEAFRAVSKWLAEND